MSAPLRVRDWSQLPLAHVSGQGGRCLIEASAGTGKTWTLTALYARLLLERQLSVGQILVVTYTTAATAELRERIRTRLADLLAIYDGTPGDDAFLQRLHARFPDEASRRRLLLAFLSHPCISITKPLCQDRLIISLSSLPLVWRFMQHRPNASQMKCLLKQPKRWPRKYQQIC